MRFFGVCVFCNLVGPNFPTKIQRLLFFEDWPASVFRLLVQRR